MIGSVLRLAKTTLVFTALAMLVLSVPVRHVAHVGLDTGTSPTELLQIIAHGHAHPPKNGTKNAVDALSILLHGHGGDHADHDHSTPFLTDPASLRGQILNRSSENRTAEADTGRAPLPPKPPPRV